MSESQRLDTWLDVACLFRTRSEAQRACAGGKVAVNGVTAKPHRTVRPGDEVRITRPRGRRQTLLVRALAGAHLRKADARALYEDTTPPPTPDEIAIRRLERQYRASVQPPKAPSARDRRALRRLKEKGY